MKISDLEFTPHPSNIKITQVWIEFPNHFGSYIITGDLTYTTTEKPFELVVLHKGSITYETPITDDVMAYLTAQDVGMALGEIEALEEK